MTKTLTALALLASTGAVWAQDDDLTIGYINKMGDHPWFVAEVEGAAEKAEELGVGFTSQDVQFNADLAITTMDTMIGDGVDGIAIVVPDRALGTRGRGQGAGGRHPAIAVDDDFASETEHQCLMSA
jgi:L-arabinose transport system substrate-binding protein